MEFSIKSKFVYLLLFLALVPRAALGFDRKELSDNLLDPSVRYQTIHTEHFEIHFPEHLKALATRLVPISETAYKKVRGYFGWGLRSKTHLVISDRSDLPSLFATSFPHKQIFLDVSLPQQSLGLNEYGDWHEWLLTHELGHIFQMDRKLGFYSGIENLIGTTAQPNMAVPNWFKEGQSVDLETKLTTRGRGDGSFYQMYLRQAVYDQTLQSNQFASLDTINSHLAPDWPWTLRAYLFGSHLVEKINSKEGRSSRLINEIAESTVIDFESSFESVMTVPLSKFWDDLKSDLTALYRKRIAEILRKPVTQFRYLTANGFQKNGLSLSPNGRWLVTTEVNPFNEGEVAMYEIEGVDGKQNSKAKREVIALRTSGAQVSFSKTSRIIAFDDVSRGLKRTAPSDVAIYDLKEKRYLSMSPNLRIRDADIHPDGKHLVFVTNGGGKNSLVMTDTAWNNPTVILDDVGYSRISSPRFDSSGERIVLTIHNDKTGGEDLVLVTDQGLRTLVANGFLNMNPSWVPGKNQILFSSDMPGRVFNIFSYDLDSQQVTKLTNVVGGLFYPVASKNRSEIYFLSYQKGGFDVAVATADQLSTEVIRASDVLNSVEFSYRSSDQVAKSDDIQTTAYSGFRYLFPQYITPSFRAIPQSYQFGVTISAVDPLYREHYELSARYDVSSNSPVGRFFYFNGDGPVLWDLEVGRQSYMLGSSEIYKRIAGQLGGSIPLTFIREDFYVRPHVDLQFRQLGTSHLHYGSGLSFYLDTEFKQIGLSFPETGSFVELGRTYLLPAYPDDLRFSLVNFKMRRHFKIASGVVYHPSFEAQFYRSEQHDEEAGFTVGGKFSFPVSSESEVNLYGYPTNAFLTKTAYVFTHRATATLRSIDRLFNFGLPIYFEKMSCAFVNQFSMISVDDRNLYPWSFGFELFQDFTLAHTFLFKASLGIYQGRVGLDGQTQAIFALEQEF